MGSLFPLVAALTGLLASGLSAQVEGPRRCGLDRDFWLVKPKSFDPAKRYWLVVLVHGFQGRGADALWMRRALAEFDDFVVVAPSFPEGYQLLEQQTDRQLILLARELGKELPLHPKWFLAGFSGGAQFSHRFTMTHPELVAGCSAHAGGTWGPTTNPAARHVPISLSCGLDDAHKSSIAQRWTRVQAAHRYFRLLIHQGFHVKARLFRGVGHATSPGTERLIAECYLLATQGLFRSQVAAAKALGATDDEAAVRRLLISPPKSDRRAKMTRHQRQATRAGHVFAGLGGRSIDGASYWVDDSRENHDGWNDHSAAREQRHKVLQEYLRRRR